MADLEKNHLKLLLILLILALFLTLIFLISSPRITGNSINFKMQTKAICNEKNYCQDYELTYQNDEIVNVKATGFGIWKQHN